MKSHLNGVAKNGRSLNGHSRLADADTGSLWRAALGDGTAIGICRVFRGDAASIPIAGESVDLVVTSPPYWRKRDYGVSDQIGQEETAEQYVAAMLMALKEWRRVLRPTGSVFLNIGDTYFDRSLAGIPGLVAAAAAKDGWLLRNEIIWAKDRGMPGPAKDRLVNRHESIFHLAKARGYYYDLFGYADRYGNGTNPGDVWTVKPKRDMSEHLAPFPDEIVERAISLACPEQVCSKCGEPRRRIVNRTTNLDPHRPQARRAMELAKTHGLTDAHLAAVQAVGISDAGKALKVQNGTGRNSARVKELAAEAKKVLGGYFREFTFAQKETAGWTKCHCNEKMIPGVVLDPFCGTGTTLQVASRMGRDGVGVDLNPPAEVLKRFPGETSPDRVQIPRKGGKRG